jgi:DNA-binding CsgD family transcriptional regulator
MKKRNRKSFGRTIVRQWDHEINVKKCYNGESSPYWDFLDKRANVDGDRSDDGAMELREPIQANPDMLGDYDGYDNERSYYTEILNEGYRALSLREKQVFNLLRLRLENKEIAKRLHVNESTIETYRDRIKNKFLELVRLDAYPV